MVANSKNLKEEEEQEVGYFDHISDHVQHSQCVYMTLKKTKLLV